MTGQGDCLACLARISLTSFVLDLDDWSKAKRRDLLGRCERNFPVDVRSRRLCRSGKIGELDLVSELGL